ncbi:MAG: tol-pal system protein YbgF [Pseudomonadales bacterium]|nr:tol-pal system protein YbgF [Pseudomonadales bacterium]
MWNKLAQVVAIVLTACSFFLMQVLAEQAPVEDRSTLSPTATSGSAGSAEPVYSTDLRETYGAGSVGQSNQPSLSSSPQGNSGNPGSSSLDSRPAASGSSGLRDDPMPAYGVTGDNRAIEQGAYNSQSGADTGGSSNAQLFYKVQILEQEVRELRGTLEELSHGLNRLAREQKDQYLDLDRRLSQQPSVRQGSEQGSARTSSGGNSITGSSGSSLAVNPETDAYNLAFSLTREKHYQEAIDGFNTLVLDFPDGKYTGNAFYWLGELYLALEKPELEKSRQSFVQIVNLYPDHAKIPDSLYKLGVVYHRLGDLIRARQYLSQVISQYPASASARLAQSYLADLPA